MINLRISSLVITAATMLMLAMKQSVSAFGPALTRRTFFASPTILTLIASPVTLQSFASPKSVEHALTNPATTVLDARQVDEILEYGFLKTDRQWVNAACTLQECPLLEVAAGSLILNKKAPVVVYCSSGKRAAKAKQVLESKGYTTVLNAGPLSGLDYLDYSLVK
jgi:phage shock protein E